MNYQFENPPTREAMCEEFGCPVSVLKLATESLSDLADSLPLDFLPRGNDPAEKILSSGEVAQLLTRWGLEEVFCLYCRRLGGDEGQIKVLAEDIQTFHCDYGVLEITAKFDKSGKISILEGRKDDGSPEGLTPDAIHADFFENEVKSEAWRNIQLEAADDFGCRWGSLDESKEILTVARYRLSHAQARRKFIAERWCDPGVPTRERLVCSLDNAAVNYFVDRAAKLSGEMDDAFRDALGRISG